MQSCVHRQWFSNLSSGQSQGQALREEWEEEGLLWQQGHYCFQATTPKKVSWFSGSNIAKCPKLVGSHNRNVYCLTVLEILPRVGSLWALWTLLCGSTLVSGSLMMFLDRWWLEGVFSPRLCLHLYVTLHPQDPHPHRCVHFWVQLLFPKDTCHIASGNCRRLVWLPSNSLHL